MLAWFRSRTRFERIFIIASLALTPTYQVFKAICHATSYGDFNVHRSFGERFLDGKPLYAGDLCFNYMPVSAMSYAPLAMVPAFVASLLRTTAAVACLAFALYGLGTLVIDRACPTRRRGLTYAAMAVLMTLQYVFRDLDDGGPHLIYLGLIVGSMLCVRRGKEGLAAVGFGLVIALKMSPGLLLPFFAWKRQWKLAILSAVATVCWIALPALWMGPSSWWDHQRQWNRLALSVASERYDTLRLDNELRVQNQALKPAIARYLVAYPPGHPLKVDHPADVAVLDLDPRLANRVGTLAVLGVLAAVAWWARRPYAGPGDPAWPVEMAAVLILMPLLSPVTWLQHLVFLIPAVYLVVVGNRAFRPLSRVSLAAMVGFLVLTLLLSRNFVGKSYSLVFLSYHVHTVAMLILLGILMAERPTVPDASGDEVLADPAGNG